MKVHLTFDDGPSDWTEPILDILGEHDAKASFFLLGLWIIGRESTVERMSQEGHTIGVHGWTHRRLPTLVGESIQSELMSTATLIESITDTWPSLWRAPHLDPGQRALEAASVLGLEHVGADIDPADWREPSSYLISDYVRTHAFDGCVVDLHDGIAPQNHGTRTRQATVDAVQRLMAYDWDFAALPVPVAA